MRLIIAFSKFAKDMSNQNFYKNQSTYATNNTYSKVLDASKTLMAKVYMWMCLALIVSGVIAYLTHTSGLFITEVDGVKVMQNKGLLWGAIILEFVLVFGISLMLNRISAVVAAALFMGYAALNGLTLSLVLAVYTSSSVVNCLFVTAGTFGVMSVLGLTTKQDLSRFGSFLMMALVGVIIASVVNIFAKSSMLDWIVSFVGLGVFIGLTAYDTNKIKQMSESVSPDSEQGRKIAVYGALQLYLDFINIFLYLLRLFGDRK